MRAAGWVLEGESLDAALPEAPPQPFVFPFVQPAPEKRKPGRPKKG